jgi:HD-like signal output (HDOD) protein
VLEVAGRDDVVPADLIGVIQIDPAITSKVLRLCNSAYYGFQREISSLEEAGTALGLETLVNLVLTTCTNRYFRDHGNASDSDHERLWVHSVTNAISSRLIASENGKVDPDRAYTAGLLQNVGHLLLDRFVQEQKESLQREVAAGRRVLEAERAVFGLHHAEIGARLATHWGLPEVLVDTIRYHHAPRQAVIDPLLASTVHLAETLSWAVGAADGLEDMPYEVCSSAMDMTGMQQSEFLGLSEKLRLEMERAREFLEV